MILDSKSSDRIRNMLKCKLREFINYNDKRITTEYTNDEDDKVIDEDDKKNIINDDRKSVINDDIKCVLIPIGTNSEYFDDFYIDVYGLTVYNNIIDALLLHLINYANMIERSGRGKWIKNIFDIEFNSITSNSASNFKSNIYNYTLNDGKIRVFKSLDNEFDNTNNSLNNNLKSDKDEKNISNMKDYKEKYLTPIFTFTINCTGESWAVFNVENIMGFFDQAWLTFYGKLIDTLLTLSPLSLLSYDELLMILDYLGRWMILVAGISDHLIISDYEYLMPNNSKDSATSISKYLATMIDDKDKDNNKSSKHNNSHEDISDNEKRKKQKVQ